MADTYTPNLNLIKPGYDSPADIERFNENMDRIDAAFKTVDAVKLGGKAPEYYIQPLNLLDNSDFRRPVNQRGKGIYEAGRSNGYAIDRWFCWRDYVIEVRDGYVYAENYIEQYLEKYTPYQVYTFACKMLDGTVSVISGTFEQGASNGVLIIGFSSATGFAYVELTAGSYLWAALYEGAYTAENLPPYVPKGYGAELAECQRYYYQTWNGKEWDGKTQASSAITGFLVRAGYAASRLYGVEMPVTMRKTPTIEFYSTRGVADAVALYDDGLVAATGIDPVYQNNKAFMPGSAKGEFAAGKLYAFHYSANADL